MSFHLYLGEVKKSRIYKDQVFDLKKLKDPELARAFQAKVEERLLYSLPLRLTMSQT